MSEKSHLKRVFEWEDSVSVSTSLSVVAPVLLVSLSK